MSRDEFELHVLVYSERRSEEYHIFNMKFSSIACTFLAAAAQVLAAEDNFFDSAAEETGLTNFELDYIIEQYPDVGQKEVAQLFFEERISVLHTITNNEESDITIVGLGGAFRDPMDGEIKVNLTANSVGPVVVPPGESRTVGQKLTLDIIPSTYALVPNVYVSYKDELKGIQSRAQLVTVKEVPVSLFGPQMLFLEAILLSIFGGIGYYAYVTYFQAYFKGAAPVSSVKASAKVSGFDPSWVPSQHKAIHRQTRSKKSY